MILKSPNALGFSGELIWKTERDHRKVFFCIEDSHVAPIAIVHTPSLIVHGRFRSAIMSEYVKESSDDDEIESVATPRTCNVSPVSECAI